MPDAGVGHGFQGRANPPGEPRLGGTPRLGRWTDAARAPRPQNVSPALLCAGNRAGLDEQHLVGIQVGNDLVFAWLDAMNRTFTTGDPVLYFTSGNCSGSPMMYVDLFRMGYITNNTLYYPAGAVTSQPYGSWRENGNCVPSSGTATFAPMATTSVASYQAPFAIVR